MLLRTPVMAFKPNAPRQCSLQVSKRNQNLNSAWREGFVVRCTVPASQPSYFEVLGVSESASLEEIKGAFRAKSKLMHPDVNKLPTASRDFMLIRRAYTTLTSEELRAEYEAKLGLPSARARDPRFTRFERWRQEVLPDLRVQLDVWSRVLDGFFAAWRASLEQRERNLARLYSACVGSLQQLHQQQTQEDHLYSPPAPLLTPSQQALMQQPQNLQHKFQQQPEPGSQMPGIDGEVASMAAAASNKFPTERSYLDSTSSSIVSGIIGVDSSRSAQAVMEVFEAALAEMAAEVAGMASDAGDGTARVDREVEKRFQQVSMMYPAYPDIVWMDVWEQTSDQWVAKSSEEAKSCMEAAKRWSERMQRLRDVMPVEIYGQLVGAGTGRFNALLSDNGSANTVVTFLP